MAQDVNARGALVRVRNPFAPIGLGLITLGVYGFVWYYKVNRELRDYGRASNDAALAESSPAGSLLACTLGGLLIVPAIVSLVGTTRRLQRVERLAGRPPVSAAIFVLMAIPLLNLAVPVLQQRHLNGVWHTHLVGKVAVRQPVVVAQSAPPTS